VLSELDPPRVDFFLYADDLEFSRRISQRYGPIKVLQGVELIDAERSWNVGERTNNFLIKARRESELSRIYYATRNRVYLDEKGSKKRKIRYLVNKKIYIILARLILPKITYEVFMTAVRNGERGLLGRNYEG
jgi:hypothetical protein